MAGEIKVNTLIVIPARLASSRLPEKIMAEIHGAPMVYWTYMRAKKANVGDVVVAVDDLNVRNDLESLGVQTMLTSNKHTNGTERVLEVAKKRTDYDWFVNVQADEPLVDAKTIKEVRLKALDPSAFYTAVSDAASGDNPSEIKVAIGKNNKIFFASRASIPVNRDGPSNYSKILGVYCYTRKVLETFVSNSPGPLEELEKVEQLRCIEGNIPLIAVTVSSHHSSIDTLADLERLRSVPVEQFYED